MPEFDRRSSGDPVWFERTSAKSQLLTTNNSKLGRSSFATARTAVCMRLTGRDSLILIIIDRFYIALFEHSCRMSILNA